MITYLFDDSFAEFSTGKKPVKNKAALSPNRFLIVTIFGFGVPLGTQKAARRSAKKLIEFTPNAGKFHYLERRAMTLRSIFVLAIASCISALGQGTIWFANIDIRIPNPQPPSDYDYSVPIWYLDDGEFWHDIPPQKYSAAILVGGVTVGLFKTDGTLLISAPLENVNNGVFFSATPVQVPDVPAGSETTLLVRAWQGTSFSDATNNPPLHWGEWSFVTQPLGGTPPNGGADIPTPGMFGWGPTDGSGLVLNPLPAPRSVAAFTSPAANAVYASPADIKVALKLASYGDGTMTNVALFLDKTLVRNLAVVNYRGDGTVSIESNGSLTLTNVAIGVHQISAVVSALVWFYPQPFELGHQLPVNKTSAPVSINVVVPLTPMLRLNAPLNGRFSFRYNSTAGLNYSVENSSDLRNWYPIATNTAIGPSLNFDEAVGEQGASYYRVNRLPNP